MTTIILSTDERDKEKLQNSIQMYSSEPDNEQIHTELQLELLRTITPETVR